tara:strand:+ start:3064 stop:4992 length:1929 start_codon:yes stop_codon:yes gene_type:complete
LSIKEEITDELKEKAQIIADATGRTYQKVLEDLLDDGMVNLSNEEKPESLVEQLKEAAELIATVQNISAEVSNNSVLNGGENSTDIVVETTLEGDIVDRAIASVERKAEKIRKIAVIVAPILLLLSGGVGLDYFLDDGDGGNSGEDDNYYEVWGCTAPDAENYMMDATIDDGTCFWSNGNGGTGPPDCYQEWRWDSVEIRDIDLTGEGYNNDIIVKTDFNDRGQCYELMDGYFVIAIEKEGSGEIYDTHQIDTEFQNGYFVEHDVFDLPAGNYIVRVDYYKGQSYWTGPSQTITMESAPASCDHDIVVDKLILSATANDLNLYVEYHDNNGCGAAIEMQFATYHNSGYTDSFMVTDGYNVANSGSTYFNIDKDDNDVMGDVEDGDWSVEFRWWVIGENENCCDYTNTVTVDEEPEPCDAHIDNLQAVDNNNTVTVSFYLAQGQNTECNDWDVEIELLPTNGSDIRYHEQNIGETSNYYTYTFTEVRNAEWRALVVLYQNENCESDCVITDEYSEPVTVDWSPEPETCDIVIYEISLFTNTTHAIVNYDLDCGTNTNELEGYNVTVNFLIYTVNATQGDTPLANAQTTCYIQGYTGDLKSLSLTNFSDGNTTHYDIYFYAFWIDAEGLQRGIEQKWLNQEMNP